MCLVLVLCVALVVLVLALYTRLATNSQKSICLCLPGAGVKSCATTS